MNSTAETTMPSWALEVLACPVCRGALEFEGRDFLCARCGKVGHWDHGMAWFKIDAEDASIRWYEAKGGTDFQKRTRINFTMSALDTVCYHDFFSRHAPGKAEIIADIGSGDGRNTLPWLRAGHTRVIAADPVPQSLANLRAAALAETPDAGDRLLLIRADARFLPLRTGSVKLGLAIEALAYLNDDYGQGLAECGRVLARDGRLVLSERSWEGGLLVGLLYGGVERFTSMQGTRSVLDGPVDVPHRNLVFTEAELLQEVEKAGLTPVSVSGLSLLSIVFGFLRGEGRIRDEDARHLPTVNAMLTELRDSGTARRTHIVLARKQGRAS